MDVDTLAGLLWRYREEYPSLTSKEKAMAADIIQAAKPHTLTEVAAWMPDNNTRLVRACVADSGRVTFDVFEPMSIQKPMPNDYWLGTDPKWITERIMALSITPVPPPPHPVEGVGMRVSASIFWIIAPEGW